MANVLLLRAPSEDSPDKYEFSLRSRGYNPFSVPVLETVIVNRSELACKIGNGPEQRDFTGVIITSKRAVEAWSGVIQDLSTREHGAADWSSVPFYVVGESTASALRAIRQTYDSPLAPKNIRGGAESGTAEALARFILNDLSSTDRPRLLYLTGDKNRDTLPSTLEKGGIALDSLQVYATQGSSRFSQDLEDALRLAPVDLHEPWGWIVFFAPSSAEFVTPTLRSCYRFPMKESCSHPHSIPNVKIAAIGPTTAKYLQDSLGFVVAVVAPKPNPEELGDSITSYDQQH